MLVKENLISFQILWKDYIKKAASTQKTKEIFAQWLDNEVMDVHLDLCGAPKEGPIDLVFENIYWENNMSKTITDNQINGLIELFRKNTEVEKLWLKWNDITDDIIWTEKEAKKELNKELHQKEDYILIHNK